MGLSSSQARLLSITTRLTSNEYESQQISNAKMRLAAQSQQASADYIKALSDTQFSFVSFNSTGQSNNTPLTVSSLYEYADNKNQYILTNSAGKVVLDSKEINIFKASKDLQDYLDRHGITKTFKSKTLENSWNNIHRSPANYGQWAQYWDKAVEDNAKNRNYQESDWTVDKNTAQTEDNFAKFISYKAAKESLLIDQIQADIKNTGGKTKIVVGKDANGKNIEVSYKDLYDNYQKYKEETGKYQNELDNLGISANRAFIYDDVTKAQWFTNLWYKLNGSSSAKTGLNNYTYLNAKEGISEFNNGITNKNRISSDDSKLFNSSTWITNALSKGYVNIEMVNNTNDEMTLEDIENPFVFNLKGIKWSGKIYSSVSDITESSNDKAVAKAEAEYQRKNAEINAKDEKFQRKLNQLDTEHNAIQTEYESVKSALNKNIERSYKAFHG
ncbi:hypothetical protein J6I39_06465 [bacterium]|nr:hypothetical protein [bacterium]